MSKKLFLFPLALALTSCGNIQTNSWTNLKENEVLIVVFQQQTTNFFYEQKSDSNTTIKLIQYMHNNQELRVKMTYENGNYSGNPNLIQDVEETYYYSGTFSFSISSYVVRTI